MNKVKNNSLHLRAVIFFIEISVEFPSVCDKMIKM